MASVKEELQALESIFEDHSITRLATMVKSRDDDATVELMDSAYWMKGCSSRFLRYAVLLRGGGQGQGFI